MTVSDPIDLNARRAQRDELVPASRATLVATADTAGDTAYEVALDDVDVVEEPGRALVKVDTPALPVPVVEGTRLPIVPVHLRPENLRSTTSRALGRASHVAAFHAVRMPWYSCKFGWFALRGAARVVGNQVRWWWVPNSVTLEQRAADAGDLLEWEKIHRQLKATRLWRGIVLGAQTVAAAITVPIVASTAPGAALAAAGAGTAALLARYGRPAGQTLTSTAVVAPRFRKLTSDIVLRAYYAAGLGNPDRTDQQVTFGSIMSRDAGNTGTQVIVDLPWGKSWSDVLKSREKIASGLDVHLRQVFVTEDDSSSRRHTLFVADRDPLAIPAGRTDLLDGKPRSIWNPVKFGKSERDALVELPLMWTSVMVAAQPRKGKTFSTRLVALHAALDPWVKIIVVDGKNSPDWLRFKLVAHRAVYGTNPSPNDADPLGRLLTILDEVLAHIEKVNTILTSLPVDVCPDGKLTEELSRDRRYPDLRVLLLVMEEFQMYFETEDQTLNKAIAERLSKIQAVGPSAGVIILSSSQKPSGVGAGDVVRLFNRYRDNHGTRFALKCGNRDVSIAALGGDAYQEGYDASALPVGDKFRGIGYLYGASDDTPAVRTFLADGADAEKILTAARKHRERLGTLTGEAAGEQVERSTRDVLADMLTVIGTDTAAHWEAIAARLADEMPEQYDGTTPEAISAQARALNVPSRDVKRDGVNRKGCRAADIRAAIERRDNPGGVA